MTGQEALIGKHLLRNPDTCFVAERRGEMVGAIDTYKNGEREKAIARRSLKDDLDEGRRSGDENGWVTASDVRTHFEERNNLRNQKIC